MGVTYKKGHLFNSRMTVIQKEYFWILKGLMKAFYYFETTHKKGDDFSNQTWGIGKENITKFADNIRVYVCS